MRRRPRLLFLAALACCVLAAAEANAAKRAACPPAGFDRAALAELKAADFKPPAGESGDALALALVGCLGHPDPALRDGVAYEGLATLLRAGAVSDATKRALITQLTRALSPETPDRKGFLKPFAALALAELARADRVERYLTDAEFAGLLSRAAAYMSSITDYRGFDERDGWRHGVAHTADLLMQIALNDRTGPQEHEVILSAIAVQVAPSAVAYVYGEPERLARPVLFIAARGLRSEHDWTEWLTGLADPALADGSEAFSSEPALARRHNINAFLYALYFNASAAGNDNMKSLRPGIIEAARQVP